MIDNFAKGPTKKSVVDVEDYKEEQYWKDVNKKGEELMMKYAENERDSTEMQKDMDPGLKRSELLNQSEEFEEVHDFKVVDDEDKEFQIPFKEKDHEKIHDDKYSIESQ